MKIKKLTIFIHILFLSIFLFARNAWARGGGGGSGGGGGGGGGGVGGGAGGSGGIGSIIPVFIFLIIFLVVTLSAWRARKNKIEKAKKLIEQAELGDSAWSEDLLTSRVREVFAKFQQDWSDFNVDSMNAYLSEEYLKRMVLEMKVLRNEGRKNIMEKAHLYSVTIFDAVDDVDNTKDNFTAEITARAHDVLFDTINNEQLFADNDVFTEFWTFVRQGNIWKLDVIKQKTENLAMKELAIEQFAAKNNFYFDPDFGWLMMPNKGAIFSKTNFKTSDINNHVVGYFRNKIVEFYTFIPYANNDKNFLQTNYVVAQAVIPKQYHDILVRRKRRFFNFGPRGLRRVQTESNDFEGRFCIWADPDDQVNSLELLTPNFMEKVYALPFELNIEVVGNFLYLYAKSRKDINYDQMLEILSWAFDEMER